MTWKLPNEVAEILAPLPPERWRVQRGSKHFKLKIDNRLVGILPKTGGNDSSQRAMKNSLAQIRRAIKEGAKLNG